MEISMHAAERLKERCGMNKKKHAADSTESL